VEHGTKDSAGADNRELVRALAIEHVQQAMELATGRWRTRDILDISVKIDVRNTWVYEIVLDRLTGTFFIDTMETLDADLRRSSDDPAQRLSPVNRTIGWTLSIGYGDMLAQQSPLKRVIVRPTAYCRDRTGEEFPVTQQLEGRLLVDPRPAAPS